MTDLNEPVETAEKAAPAKARGKAKAADGKPRGNGRESRKRALPEAKLLEVAELLFFAYRDFTRDPDAILKDFGFGRAHHRVLHFVNRHSGLRVADLLDILTITKQSLGRVLKQLIDKGYIVQQAGSADRRERLLFPTERGRALAERLAAPQLVRLSAALKEAGPGSEAVLRRFLEAMVNAEERPKVSSIMASPVPDEAGSKGDG
ncbi:MAG TPA: MarR family transcriptional regulator [Methyloceanibacter sp.]|jgi:DNA-binding MarR family transcriptional regulator|nr:MarR family transcriptional regulator [Methyloceanibacter sp.]